MGLSTPSGRAWARRESHQALREGTLELPDSYTAMAFTDRPTEFPGMTLVRRSARVVIDP